MALPKARTIKTILRQGYDYRNRCHLRLCTLLLAEVAGEWFFPSFTLIHGQDVWISEVRQQNPKGCKAGVRRRYAFANTCATIGWCGPSRTNHGAVRQQLPRRERKSRWILPSQGCLSVSGRSAGGMAGMVGSWTSDMPDPITHSATVLPTLRPVRSNCVPRKRPSASCCCRAERPLH